MMRTFLLLTAGTVAFVPAMAAAQSTDTPPTTDQAVDAQAAQADGLVDIVVTAQRQVESSQSAAIPLSVVDGDALREKNITQVEGLNSLAPALSITPTNTGNAAFVRGVGNFTLAPNSDPAIAFNYDGVYVGRPTSTTGVFYDLDRVEVLKGPQGILYGRNATGGAINVIPNQPRLGDRSGYASLVIGNYETVNAQAALNLPLGGRSAVRIAGSRSTHDGYLSDGTSDERTSAVRLQFKSEITDALTIRIAGDYAHNGGLGSGVDSIGFYGATLANFTPSNIPIGTGLNAPISQAFRTSRITAAGNMLPPLSRPFVDNTFYGINAEISYDTGIGTLIVIPAYRKAELNFLANAGGSPYFNREDDTQYSLEARFAGERVGPLDYQIGAYYYDEFLDVVTQLTSGLNGNFQQPKYDTKSYAGFGRLTLHLNDQLRLVGGLRYTEDKKRFDTVQLTAVITCTRFVAGVRSCPTAPTVPLFDDPSDLGYAFPAPGGAPVPIIVNGVPSGALSIRRDIVVVDRRLNNDKLTYRGAVEFDVGPKSLLYASVESGYRSGGFSVATGFETYMPETILAYTIGSKNRFFDNRLQFNLEAFLWDYKNQQVSRTALDLAGNNANYVQNIGSSEIKGFEVDTQFLVTPLTLIGANLQYLDAEQKDFTFPQAPDRPLTGCPISTVTATSFIVDCSGFPSYNSPKWTLNLSGRQTIELGENEIVLSADTQHRSSRYIGFAYLPAQLIGPSWSTNAQIKFGPSNESWSISAFVRNIENERTPIYSIVGNARFFTFGTTPPRTYGIRLATEF